MSSDGTRTEYNPPSQPTTTTTVRVIDHDRYDRLDRLDRLDATGALILAHSRGIFERLAVERSRMV